VNTDSSKYIDIYTDGACSGNPGKGGWGVYLKIDNEEIEFNGSQDNTTNNRMELTAVIEALKYLKNKSNINLFTDSKYVMQGIEEWIYNWKKNNWKTSRKEPVKNKELWIELDKLVSLHNIQWKWVKGHSGDYGNEKADYLATTAIK
tara:strand:+ start:550 stop:990 length:441 start_codon:yes stop_codon:yes gene_type:complete